MEQLRAEAAGRALGPHLGRVTNQWTDPIAVMAAPVQPCEWGSPDGTATFLPLGTPIHAVPSYATTFRLAVRHGDTVVLY